MRPKERRETGQADLLRSRLDAIIDMDPMRW
jgi:IS5 family transposase